MCVQVVLRDFNLEVPGGRVVALVGMSGGGELFVAEPASLSVVLLLWSGLML